VTTNSEGALPGANTGWLATSVWLKPVDLLHLLVQKRNLAEKSEESPPDDKTLVAMRGSLNRVNSSRFW